MAINKKASKSLKIRAALAAHEEVVVTQSHENFMKGPSYVVGNPVNLLRTAAASCFFGEPQYYRTDLKPAMVTRSDQRVLSVKESSYLSRLLVNTGRPEWKGMSPTEMMEWSIDNALNHDPEATLRLAVELRHDHNIRVTPQVIMVRAAHHDGVRGKGLIRKYAKEIMCRADEPATQLAYQLWKYGRKQIPNSLKRAWKDVLETFTEYDLAKYNMSNREVKLVDVINLAHPASGACSKFVKGELSNADATWEALISQKGSSQSSWVEAIPLMGHMALLRNLRNFHKAEVPVMLYLPKLIATAATGKQLPFRYVSAYKALEELNRSVPSVVSGRVIDAVEECLEISIDNNLPSLKGKVISLSDNSGSAHGATTSAAGTMTVAEIDNLMAIITAKASDEGYVGVFGDSLDVIPIRKKSSVFDELVRVNRVGLNIGHRTENGIWTFWSNAIKAKQHWDHVFVYSDMQAGHGGLYGLRSSEYSDFSWVGDSHKIDVPKLIIEYRNQVNPNVMVYLIQTAGYTDTIIPEFYDRTYILGGWSDAVLKFAAEMSAQYPTQQ